MAYYGNSAAGQRLFNRLQPDGPFGPAGRLLGALTAPPQSQEDPAAVPSHPAPAAPRPQYRALGAAAPAATPAPAPALTPSMLGAGNMPAQHAGGNGGGQQRHDHLPGSPEDMQKWLAGGGFKDSRKARGPMWALLRQLIDQANGGPDAGYEANVLAPSLDAINGNEKAAVANLDALLAQRGLEDSSAGAAALGSLEGGLGASRAKLFSGLKLDEQARRDQAQAHALALLTALRSGARGQAAQIAQQIFQDQMLREQMDQQNSFGAGDLFSGLGGLAGLAFRGGWRPFGGGK